MERRRRRRRILGGHHDLHVAAPFLRDPREEVAVDRAPDAEREHARIAEAYGVKAWRVEDPAKLDAAIKAAMEHDGPALIDVVAQPLQDAAAPVSQWMG